MHVKTGVVNQLVAVIDGYAEETEDFKLIKMWEVNAKLI